MLLYTFITGWMIILIGNIKVILTINGSCITEEKLSENDIFSMHMSCIDASAEEFMYEFHSLKPSRKLTDIFVEIKKIPIPNIYVIKGLQDRSALTRYLYINIENNLTDFEVEYIISTITNVKTLDVRQNKLTRLPQLSRETQLEDLYMSENNVHHIYANYNLMKLVKLDLRRCNISYIHKNAFDREINYALRHLDLSNNKIADLNSSLRKICGLEVLDLRNNLIQYLKTTDICHASFLRLDNNKLFATKFAFTSEYPIYKMSLDTNGFGNIDNATIKLVMEFQPYLNKTYNVQELTLNSDLRLLPPNAFDCIDRYHYAYRSKLALSNTSLSQISEGAFNGMRYAHMLEIKHSNLTILANYVFNNSIFSVVDLSYSNIWAIDANAFYGTLIEKLILSNNSLTVVNPNIFCDTGLNELDLSHNKIKLFKYLSCENNIETLNLQSNVLVSIDNFGMFSDLVLLNVSNNNISKLETSFANSFRNLEILDLSGNKLSKIGRNAFQQLKKLQFLFLNDNNITKIHPEAFAYDSFDFKNLYLSYNGAFEPEMLSRLCHLANLTLTNSAISLLNRRSFTGLLRLENLHLIDVTVEKIETGCFLGLINLIEGDLACVLDDIGQFENGLFRGLSSLVTLNVSHTNLNGILHNSFEGMDKLTSLVLSHNNITRLDIGCFLGLTKLKVLRLDNNALTKFDIGVFSGLVSLEVLDVSSNEIQALDTSVLFPVLPTSRQLILSGNKLMELEHVRLLQMQHHLEYINLTGNLWKCQYLVELLGNLTKYNIKYRRSGDNFVYDNENIDGVHCIDTCKFLYCHNVRPETFAT